MINKENFNNLLNAFAKEYRKQHGKTPLEITIVGGGSILINYGFREMTRDFDVLASTPDVIKDVSLAVANKYNLTPDWMNEDFKFTKSYSPKIKEVSRYYRSLNNGSIVVRTVDCEYLAAMKMQADREFEHDVSDIIGVIKDELDKGNRLTFEKIMSAGSFLYGENFDVSESLKTRVLQYTQMTSSELEDAYLKSKGQAAKIKEILISEDVTNRNETKERGIRIEEELKSTQRSLVVMCGLPGSGKSKKAKELFEGYKSPCKLISAYSEKEDARIWYGKEDKEVVFKRIYEKIGDNLSQGISVIYDASNLKKSYRKKLIEIANANGVDSKELYYMSVQKNTALANCLQNDVFITKHAIEKLSRELNRDFPSIEEGWDKFNTIEVPEKELSAANLDKLKENEKMSEKESRDKTRDLNDIDWWNW